MKQSILEEPSYAWQSCPPSTVCYSIIVPFLKMLIHILVHHQGLQASQPHLHYGAGTQTNACRSLFHTPWPPPGSAQVGGAHSWRWCRRPGSGHMSQVPRQQEDKWQQWPYRADCSVIPEQRQAVLEHVIAVRESTCKQAITMTTMAPKFGAEKVDGSLILNWQLCGRKAISGLALCTDNSLQLSQQLHQPTVNQQLWHTSVI